MKKIVKLINNERMNRKITASKACESDPTATDICQKKDYADCTVYAFDACVKDHAGCTQYATDYCDPVRDLSACSGVNETDY